MSRPDPTAAALAPPCADASARARIDRQMATLVRLTEIGMQIAEAAGRRAAEGGGADAAEPSLSYARAARAVRLTLALESRLASDLETLDKARARARTDESDRRRHRIRHHVEEAIEAECADSGEARTLRNEARERLTDTDDADILDRPLAEVVAWICRDLGLSPEPFVVGFSAPADEESPPFAADKAQDIGDGDPAPRALEIGSRRDGFRPPVLRPLPDRTSSPGLPSGP